MSEFQGEYIGGNIILNNLFETFYTKQFGIPKSLIKNNLILRVDAQKIELLPCFPRTPSKLASQKPIFIIPIKAITNVQAVPYEHISTLRVFALGVVPGLLWRKNNSYLNVSFKDDFDMEQSTVYRIDKINEAYQAIYNSIVAERKRTKSQ